MNGLTTELWGTLIVISPTLMVYRIISFCCSFPDLVTPAILRSLYPNLHEKDKQKMWNFWIAIIRRLQLCCVSYCVHSCDADLLLLLLIFLLVLLLLAGTHFMLILPITRTTIYIWSHPFKCTMQSPMLCFSKKHTFNLNSPHRRRV